MASSGGAGGLGGSQRVDVSSVQAKAAAADAKEVAAAQEASEASMTTMNPDVANPAAAARTTKKEEKFKTLESRKKTATAETKKADALGDKSTDLADSFAQDNPEVSDQDLRSLQQDIEDLGDGATPEDILKAVDQKYPDPVNKMHALEYLERSTPASKGALKDAISQAKQQLLDANPQALTGGKNVFFASTSFANQLTNTSPSSLRSLYLDVTTTRHSSSTMFNKLSAKYSHEEMKIVAKFITAGISADLKSEGPSVAPPKLMLLLAETNHLLATLNMYSHFESKLPPVLTSLKNEGVDIKVDYQATAKAFHNCVSEPYLTAAKADKELSGLVGDNNIAKDAIAQLFLRSIPSIHPSFFASMDHRGKLQTTLKSLLDKVNENNPDYPKPTDFPKPKPYS